MSETIPELPVRMPVMVLRGVTLFPHAMLPLRIFEPRYRSMLEEALDDTRMLAMAMPRDREERETEPVAGAGIVRACIRNADGTSNLILQGVARVRFAGWDQTEPYRIARVECLPSSGEDDGRDLGERVTRLHALCSRFKEQGVDLPAQFEAYLGKIGDIGVLTDLVASTLVADPLVRQALLEETSIPRRLEKLLAGLKTQLS